jgi:uncharacterized protein (DUF305 family)
MRYRTIILVIAGLLLITGCSTGKPAAIREPNATDVMFLQMMVAGENGTAELIHLAEARTLPAEITTLTEAIRTTQADESRTMQGWLRSWRQPITMDPDTAVHAHHGGAALSPTELGELRRASPADFRTRFLSMLIAQQHNAVDLARMETATGSHPGAQDLAHRIDQSRTAQIATLLTLAAQPSTPS